MSRYDMIWYGLIWYDICHVVLVVWLLDGVWIWWLDLLHLYTQLGTTCKYSATTDLHILQFTVTHTLVFSVFTSRILATDLYQSHCNYRTHEVFFSQPHCCNSTELVAISSQSSSRDSLNYYFSWPGILVIWRRVGSNKKHRFYRYRSTILRLLLVYSLPREFVYRIVD
jgi:hypothetical protein